MSQQPMKRYYATELVDGEHTSVHKDYKAVYLAAAVEAVEAVGAKAKRWESDCLKECDRANALEAENERLKENARLTMDDTIPTRERCAVCHKISSVGFHVPNELWLAVVHPQFNNSILCLNCFISYADEKQAKWDRVIKFYPVSLASHLAGDC
jgi:hypothetical protein